MKIQSLNGPKLAPDRCQFLAAAFEVVCDVLHSLDDLLPNGRIEMLATFSHFFHNLACCYLVADCHI